MEEQAHHREYSFGLTSSLTLRNNSNTLVFIELKEQEKRMLVKEAIWKRCGRIEFS